MLTLLERTRGVVPTGCLAAVAVLVIACGASGVAQSRPVAKLTSQVVSKTAAPGGTVQLSLRVALPEGLHVQANKPRDPALIATVLTVEPPKGVSLIDVVYPKATDFAQAGASQPLAVYPNEFDIVVRVKLDPGVAPGSLVVPAKLRYQACNDSICFIPARAETSWTLAVGKG